MQYTSCTRPCGLYVAIKCMHNRARCRIQKGGLSGYLRDQKFQILFNYHHIMPSSDVPSVYLYLLPLMHDNVP